MRGDAAVLTAHRRSHLAVDFAADHIAASEDVWHVRAQEFIHADLPFLAKLNSGFFDADIVRILAPARSHYQFLGTQLAPLTARLDLDDYFLSVLSHRAHDRAGNHFDSGDVATLGLDLISWLLRCSDVPRPIDFLRSVQVAQI